MTVLSSLTASLTADGDSSGGGALPDLAPGSYAGTLPGGSGFEGGNSSSRRGYVYFPTLDTGRELPPWSRLEMLRRARWCTRNIGYAKRCTRGLALMVGYLSPRAFTGDKEWNRLAEQTFERRAGRAPTFDRTGRFNFYSMQPQMTATRLTDGDMGLVLTESQTGGALVSPYEAHQIGTGITDLNTEQWRDGVRIIADRAYGYRLLDAQDPGRFTDIPAQDFIHHGEFLSFGHTRPVTPFHCVLNNMLDTTEIRSDLKLGIKLSNKIGYYIQRDQLTKAGPKGMGVQQRTYATQADGSGKATVEDTWRGGKLLTLDPGEEIKQLLDQRPHPNSIAFLDDINRDISWGFGLSPDVLWNIAKLGGASVRFALADAQVWIEAQQQLLVDQFLHRFWVYFIAKEMKAGRLKQCADPEWYWKCGWQPQAKLTVDIGRDGKLSIDLHQAGMLTLQRWYGSQGLDHEEELRQHVREYALRIKLCEEVGKEFGMELDPDKVFPPAPGQSATAFGGPVGPGETAFGAPESFSRVMLEMRDDIAQLRAAA